MNSLVSILIPAYKAERWIAATIKSCLAQSWPHIELIIVDDGSGDRTLSIARQFERPNVKVVTQSNSGAPVARNHAFQLAQGAFVQWLDADDLLHPDKIAHQMRVAREVADPMVLLSGPFGTFYRRIEKAQFDRTNLWADLTPIEYMVTRFNENVCFQTDAWLVSRELTDAAGPWSDIGSPDDDGEYFCRVASRSRLVKFVPEAKCYYRQGVGGALHLANSPKKLDLLFESKLKSICHLRSMEDSPRTRAASIQLLQDWLPYFHPERADIVARAQDTARDLGGTLTTPRLKWKYRPIEWLSGHSRAARVSRSLPALKSRFQCEWDEWQYKRQHSTPESA